MAQVGGELFKIEFLKQLVDGFGAHLGHKLLGIAVFEIAVLLGELFESVHILLFGEQVESLKRTRALAGLHLNLDIAGIDHHVALIVDDIV